MISDKCSVMRAFIIDACRSTTHSCRLSIIICVLIIPYYFILFADFVIIMDAHCNVHTEIP